MKRLCSLLVSAIALALPLWAQQGDNSDWWSNLRGGDQVEEQNTPEVNPVERHTDLRHLRIGGVPVVGDMFKSAEHRFGPVTRIHRGDASTGRRQACYTSTQGVDVFLIFEEGEVAQSAYLFATVLCGMEWTFARNRLRLTLGYTPHLAYTSG